VPSVRSGAAVPARGRGAHTDTNSYAVTQREPYPHAESQAKAASDSTASPNAAVSALISSFPRRSLGENGLFPR
jgi:hypothetical protein